MATVRQRQAARKNIKQAQARWRKMTSRQHARAQPQGRSRQRPGSSGKGEYYHVAVRPKSEFATFRTHDVGKRGHIQRVAGKRSSGSWSTVKWLIGKSDAHVSNGRLVADTPAARSVLGKLGSAPRHISGDRFKATDRPNVPERKKPTAAQQRARSRNIRKAQTARQRKR